MERIEFDLTTREGILNVEKQLKELEPTSMGKTYIGAVATINFDVVIKSLTDMISNFVNRFFDLFDDTKKLEKQMELAKETIRIARELGAKSIVISINKKNKAELKGHIEEINGDLKVKFDNGNKLTYDIKFD